MAFAKMIHKKRALLLLRLSVLAFLLLALRLFYIQIIKGEYYKEKAYLQQTKDRAIAASRGTIYDTKGNKLALSVSTNTLSIAPTNIETKDKEKLAKDLAEILDMSWDGILAKINKTVSLVTIATNIEKEKAEQLTNYIYANELKGVYVDESTNRIYPYGAML